MATGRVPKIQGLGLEEVGVKLGEGARGGASTHGSKGRCQVFNKFASCGCCRSSSTGCTSVRGPCVQSALHTTGRALRRCGAVCAAGKRGEIAVNEYSQTSVPSIWAVGDVTDRINLTPVALMEGMALAKTVALNQPTKPDYRTVPSAVFSNPNIATVVGPALCLPACLPACLQLNAHPPGSAWHCGTVCVTPWHVLLAELSP